MILGTNCVLWSAAFNFLTDNGLRRVERDAFDPDGMKGIMGKFVKMLSKMENGARATLVDKIVLYLQKTLRLGNGKASFPAAFGLKGF